YFDTGDATPAVKPRKPFDVLIDKIVLNDIGFRYKNFKDSTKVSGINFNDIDLRSLSATILDLDTKNHLAKASLKNLTFREKSGFYLKNLTTNATVDTNQMEFRDLLLETANTRIADYFLMEYDSLKDFSKFLSQVHLKARFNKSMLSSSDMAYFAPGLARTTVSIQVDGAAEGDINDLRAQNLSIRAGQATYLKGNFSVSGLPDIKSTMLDLEFDQVSTNKKDLEMILTPALGSGKPFIPPVIEKFGHINFSGRFTGF